MGAETSDPGGQQDVSFTDKDDEALEVAERALDTDALNPSLYGDYAGSSKFSAQQKGSITGSRAMDALVPGVGTLSVVSALSADYMQQSLQRGASPVYGGGQIQGVVNETQAFGTTFSTYSGNTDYDPIGNNNNTSGGNNSGVVSTGNRTVKAPAANVSTAGSSRYSPSAVVSASGSNSNITRSGGQSTILTSSRGDASQLTTIMKPGLRGTLG